MTRTQQIDVATATVEPIDTDAATGPVVFAACTVTLLTRTAATTSTSTATPAGTYAYGD